MYLETYFTKPLPKPKETKTLKTDIIEIEIRTTQNTQRTQPRDAEEERESFICLWNKKQLHMYFSCYLG